MKTRDHKFWKPVLLCLAAPTIVHAQGNFQNPGFESANLPPVPAGQSGGEVSSLDSIPGWTVFLGTNQMTVVLHNDATLGNASIDILGPNWNRGGIIEGQFTIILQPGRDPFGSGNNVGASLRQTGLVPAAAQSIRFTALANQFSLSLGGQNLSVVQLGAGPNFTSYYGADIPPSLAGQNAPLTVAILAGPNSFNYFDSFAFSSSRTPEPTTWGLFVLGSMVFGLGRWRTG